MKNGMSAIIFLSSLVACTSLIGSSEAATRPARAPIEPTYREDRVGNKIEPIESDDRYQMLFEQIGRTGHNYTDYLREVAIVLRLAEGDGTMQAEELLRQMIYYLTTAPESGWLIVPNVIDVGRSVNVIQPTSALEVALPFLGSKDPKVRQAAGKVALRGGVLDRNYGYNEHPALFSHVVSRFDRWPNDLPASIAKAMYGLDPSAALASMARLYREELQPAERERLTEEYLRHVKWLKSPIRDMQGPEDEPRKAELRELARSGHWWVRLYVAEVLCRHKDLRGQDLVALLARDANELVREAAPRPDDR